MSRSGRGDTQIVDFELNACRLDGALGKSAAQTKDSQAEDKEGQRTRLWHSVNGTRARSIHAHLAIGD